MKIKEINENGTRLKVWVKGYFYAIDLFKDFKSKRELDSYMLDMFGTKLHQYSYGY